MEQRDYILREIEKIGAMIAGLIGKMIPLKEKGFLEEDEWIDLGRTIEEDLNINLDRLLSTPSHQFDQLLTRDLGFDASNIELLADLLADIAEIHNQDKLLLKETAIDLYEMANRNSKIFSLERAAKINRLKTVKPK
ncbi:MAG: hypothetical protein KQI35_14775 [Bacteroidetes bacterium]|nr:hypothetical protein [Bacteroidota bacterium]